MSPTLYYHPLASFCWKVLIALYENDTAFERHIVDLGDPDAAASFKKIWPIGLFPVLRDDANGRTVPESSIIIEYLAQHHPGRVPLIPADPELARETRLQDRFFDLYVSVPMQKVVTDRLRPPAHHDAYGVEQARALLRTACAMTEQVMANQTWAVGETFTMADCAAAPALFYANEIMPFDATLRNTRSYLDRLMARPSFARTLAEAKPYFAMFPQA
jgi:glutathione S-transferase